MTNRKIHLSFRLENILGERILTVFRGKTREGFLKDAAKYSVANTQEGLEFKELEVTFDISKIGLDIRSLAVIVHYLGETPEYINSSWTHSSRAILHIVVERGSAFKFSDTLSWHDFREVEKLALNMSRDKKLKHERVKIGSAYVEIK